MVESQGFAPCLVSSEQTVLLITQTLHKGVRRRGPFGIDASEGPRKTSKWVAERFFRIVTLGYRLERCSEKESNPRLLVRSQPPYPLNYPNVTGEAGDRAGDRPACAWRDELAPPRRIELRRHP